MNNGFIKYLSRYYLAIVDECRQYRLPLQLHCTYRCLDCRWWQRPLPDPSDQLSLAPSFFSAFKPNRIVNVLGGDPVMHPQFYDVLQGLGRRSARIRLWTTGVGHLSQWETILPQLERLYLYVPSGDPAQYQAMVGTSTWAQLRGQICLFKSILSSLGLNVDVALWLNYEVRSETLQYLPELYELVYEWGCSLLIHCDRSRLVDRESVLCVKRFYHVPNVDVIFTCGDHDFRYCSGVPTAVTAGGWQWIRNRGYAMMNRIVS